MPTELRGTDVAADPQLVALISSQVSDSLDKRLQDRESRSLKMLGALTAVILFIGYAGIREMISTSSNSAADAAIQKRMVELEVPLILAMLATTVAKAESKGSFSHTERAEMIASLERLADGKKKGSDVTRNPAFLSALESVIDTMANSGNDLFVDKAYDLFPEECLRNSGTVQTLLQHYGRQAAGAVGSVQTESVRRFDQIERAAGTHKIPEYSLPHRLLIDFRAASKGGNAIVLETLQHVGRLTGSDKEKAFEFLTDYAKHEFTKRARPHTIALQELTISLLTQYSSELEKIGYPAAQVLREAKRKQPT